LNGNIGLEAVVILILVIANGLFAMSEIAVVTARRSNLQHKAEAGNKSARLALELSQNPDQFLSTVQVGITIIGTLAGAFGGLTIAEQLAVYISRFPRLEAYAEEIAFAAVVTAISYLSLIIGELVPKRIALTSPERFAIALAPLMKRISKVTSPAVRFLTWSTNLVFRLIPIRHSDQAGVTEEEIKSLIEQGAQAGVVAETEQDMVEGVFRLGDRRAFELMTPRGQVVWIDVSETLGEILAALRTHPFSRLPVCDGSVDHVIGVVHTRDLLLATADGNTLDLRKIAREPLFIPETVQALKIAEIFRTAGAEIAFVVDEHGGVEGLLTIADIVESVLGDFPQRGEPVVEYAVRRPDGSWLVDGAMPISELEGVVCIRHRDSAERSFTTVGGLVMTHLGRVPKTGDTFVADNVFFEVLDMDGNRVDKVLVRKNPEKIDDVEG
jgi:putative hemolysin